MSSPTSASPGPEQLSHGLNGLNLNSTSNPSSAQPATDTLASTSNNPTSLPPFPAGSGLASSSVGAGAGTSSAPPPTLGASQPQSAPAVPLASGALSGAGGPPRRPPGAGGALRQGVRGNAAAGSAGGIRMPPSLAAKMAAVSKKSISAHVRPLARTEFDLMARFQMASRSSSGTPTPSSNSQPGSAPRIPTLSATASTSALPTRTSAPTPGGAPPPVMPRPGVTGRPGAPGGGMAARRKLGGPGLTLSAMKAPSPVSNGNEGEADYGNGFDGPRPAPGAMSPSREQGGTPFANFSKIV